jgi:hypothetical protein
MATDTHDKMIEAFQEYFKWQDHFEWNGSEQSGIKARFWLSEIRRQAHIRRKEIQDKRNERRKARNGRNGRPPKIHNA